MRELVPYPQVKKKSHYISKDLPLVVDCQLPSDMNHCLCLSNDTGK